MLNFEDTIISQYDTAPTLTQLITNINTYIDPTADLDAFYNLIWNVDTAQGIGLGYLGPHRRRRPGDPDIGRQIPRLR
jgi:hypothetical protein